MVVRQICTQVTIVCDGMVRIPSCEQCSVVTEEEKRASGRIMVCTSVRAKAETVLYPCLCRCDESVSALSFNFQAMAASRTVDAVVLRLTGYASFPHELSILYGSQSQGKFINAVEVKLGLHGKKRCSTAAASILFTIGGRKQSMFYSYLV